MTCLVGLGASPLPSENTAIRRFGSDCTASLDLLIGGKRLLLGKGVW